LIAPDCSIGNSVTVQALVKAAKKLRNETRSLRFAQPVACVYNPLTYAWAAHEFYLTKFGQGSKRVLFLGMNPGPFGMAQTGVPFGEITAVRDWLGIRVSVGRPECEHPKRPITGFNCLRSEVSGRRLWALFAARFGVAEHFFTNHFVVNYCPLAFMEDGGRNVTPDKLRPKERHVLFGVCDEHLRTVARALDPEWIIGVGEFARNRAQQAMFGEGVKISGILHPSPASPAANRDWAGAVTAQLRGLGIWT
jgi:single-strand selective monofunctional uracil DNA glycosylase